MEHRMAAMGCACLTREEIAAARPEPPPPPGHDPIAAARARMQAHGQWHPWQTMGRRWGMGCVALEITQRCNLDCALCYLSESSEAVHDIPLAEVLRRLDAIRDQYGAHTDVQITGGDPTLRDRAELVAIVRHAARIGLRPALFTNGIRATRDLLAELAAAGLVDVAFHVDMSQGRRGYADEVALHALRSEYIARARGLGLSVLFNTTVFDGNFDAVPEIVRFFVRHAADVRLASFQLQADTGRGVAGAARSPIRLETVAARIREGADAPVGLTLPLAGHAACNRYALTLVANGRVYDLYDTPAAVAAALAATGTTPFDRRRPGRAIAALALSLLRRPTALAITLPALAKKFWAMRADLVAARGRVHKLSFFLHDFMDAAHLDRERIGACIFVTQTAEGPISMCLHNAKRDAFILQPLRTGDGWWQPLTGQVGERPPAPELPRHTAKTAKGRVRFTRVPGATRVR